MSKTEEDVKPEAGGKAVITLKVKDSAGHETVFRVKRSTKMQKVFNAYAGRLGIDVKQFRFLFEGKRVKSDDTPDSLELEEGDWVDAVLHQIGGCGTGRCWWS